MDAVRLSLAAVVVAALVSVCDGTPSPGHISVVLDCERLWQTLLEVIPEATGMTQHDAATACFERVLVVEARHALLDSATLEATADGGVLLSVAADRVAELLVWSISGRACSQNGSGDKDVSILEFVAAEGRFEPRKPRCEFERGLYSSMLLVAVVLIVYLVVRPAEVEAGAEAEEVAAGAKGASSASLNAKAPMHSHAGSHAALPAVRYRLLRT